jgi:hypothetical protein
MSEKINEFELKDELSEIFDTPPETILVTEKTSERCPTVVQKPQVQIASTKEKTNDQLAEDDFNYARQNLHDVIDIGKMALENLAQMAEDSATPRCHEIVGELMKNIADSTRELFELHQKMKNLKKESVPGNQSANVSGDMSVTNNNLFLTTSELLKFIKDNSAK